VYGIKARLYRLNTFQKGKLLILHVQYHGRLHALDVCMKIEITLGGGWMGRVITREVVDYIFSLNTSILTVTYADGKTTQFKHAISVKEL